MKERWTDDVPPDFTGSSDSVQKESFIRRKTTGDICCQWEDLIQPKFTTWNCVRHHSRGDAMVVSYFSDRINGLVMNI